MANIKNELKKRCNVCGKMRSPNSFYASKSEYHADGRLPICKKCFLEKSINDEQTDIDLSRFQKLLQQCDKPFIAKVFNSAVSQAEYQHPDKKGAEKIETEIGYYMKNLNGLYQYQKKGWEDSIFETDEQSDNQPDNDQEDYIVISDDGYKYSPLQFEAVLALFKYLQSIYQYQKGSQEYELLKVYSALRLQAEADAATEAVEEFHKKESTLHDLLTVLHWED